MRQIKKQLKRIFWKVPLPGNLKENLRVRYTARKFANETDTATIMVTDHTDKLKDYAMDVLGRVSSQNEEYREFEIHAPEKMDVTLIAYYLTQYSPDIHNDLWWGKGTTEWNNVSRAVPQFAGHRQPRLPGELGFYDLRLKEVFQRQIELAKNYGIGAFSFYYYWFAGERILEGPLNLFLNDPSLDMPFLFCWANENWTRRFSGVDSSVLIGMDNTVENYKAFIHEIMPYFADSRYLTIDGKYALQIYKPNSIPSVSEVLAYWREQVQSVYGKDLYLIACPDARVNWIQKGFDAENEWMQGSIRRQCKDITEKVHPIRKDFSGDVMDYEDMVLNKRYYIKENRTRKIYPAIMPSWDNSARRDYKGTIWHGSTPALYKRWLSDLISETRERTEKGELDAPLIFVNAWNEWGEGAYLEPDRDYGYAILQATWEALNENRK